MPATLIKQYIRKSKKVQLEMFPILRRDLIFEDDEPMESNDHRDFMNNLIHLVRSAFGLPVNYFVAGNVAVYFSPKQIKNRSFKAPDFILVKNVDGSLHRDGWVVWEEDYKFPDLIIELLSPSTEKNDLGSKKDLYEQVFLTPEYFVCDPFDPDRLQGWRLQNGVYVKITPNENGWLWSEELGFYLGYWKGAIVNQTKNWLRFYDQYGHLVLLTEETAKIEAKLADERARQAEEETKLADIQARQAEEEAKQADQRAKQAEEETKQADIQARQAEEEVKQADQRAKQADERAKQAEEKILNAIKNMLNNGFSSAEIADILGVSVEIILQLPKG